MGKPTDLHETVIVDGGRTPFLRSQTEFKKFTAFDLGRIAVSGLISKTALDEEMVDHIWYGNVIQDINTSNVAREISIAAGIPDSISATTVSMACISSNIALTLSRKCDCHRQYQMLYCGRSRGNE